LFSVRARQNFACNILESQMNGRLTDPDGRPGPLMDLLEKLDLSFTGIFAAELAVNMFSNLWERFVKDSW
jgi:hypothetical protein